MEVRCYSQITRTGCVDYRNQKTGDVIKDIAPLFYVKGIIRSLEIDDAADELLIDVNNHNRSKYEFRISMDSLYQPNLLMELSRNKVVVSQKFEDAVKEHLLYGYRQCDATNSISYKNSFLGWYEFEDEMVYFYDTTDFKGIHSEYKKSKILFKRGNKEDFDSMLKSTVFPSVELSLALTIGYSAVLASRLDDEYDIGTIVVNLCGTSSTGKSTAEMLMVAPFMCPEISNKGKGLASTALATENAIYAKISGIHGVPFVVDDINTNKDLNLTTILYSLVDGSPKGRCNGDGGLRDPGEGWNGVVITSSEKLILDQTEAHQGLKARVIQTEGIQWTSAANEAELIKRVVRKNYGFGGKEFAHFIQELPFEDLCERYDASVEVVDAMMKKKDNLSSRLRNKYAVIHTTAGLLNEAFGYTLSADTITERIIRCEQENFEARDNATKALDYVIDFIMQKQSHFDIETHLQSMCLHTDTFASGDYYGKIFKYDDHWNVQLLASKTEALLEQNNIPDIKWVRKRWIERGIAEGDSDHNTKQKTDRNGHRARVDCITIPGGITLPTPDVPTPQNTAPTIPQNPPVSDYHIDDSEQIDAIFGGANGTKD